MKDYKRGSHTICDCKYHWVWVTKYRYEVLVGDVGLRCRELLREITPSQDMVIYAGSINRDHVQLLIGIAPQLSVSRAVQFLKGKNKRATIFRES
jgi:putative transposase